MLSELSAQTHRPRRARRLSRRRGLGRRGLRLWRGRVLDLAARDLAGACRAVGRRGRPDQSGRTGLDDPPHDRPAAALAVFDRRRDRHSARRAAGGRNRSARHQDRARHVHDHLWRLRADRAAPAAGVTATIHGAGVSEMRSPDFSAGCSAASRGCPASSRRSGRRSAAGRRKPRAASISRSL